MGDIDEPQVERLESKVQKTLGTKVTQTLLYVNHVEAKGRVQR